MLQVGEGAGGTRKSRCSTGNIGIGLVSAFETTDPFGGMPLVVMAIAGQPVPMWAEWDAVLVIAARQTSERQVISFGMAQTDGAQGLEIVVNKLQDFIVAFARIAKQFPNFERGKTLV